MRCEQREFAYEKANSSSSSLNRQPHLLSLHQDRAQIHSSSTRNAVKEYKSGKPHNSLYGRMRNIAKKMSVAEIIDLAHYYAGMDRWPSEMPQI